MNYNLERFIIAQEENYQKALSEIKQGKKQTHWIWYIFPQLKELGASTTAKYYGLANIEEAKEYYSNEYLKTNLLEISRALLEIENKNIKNIMGYPDYLKLKSCMTLFQHVNPNEKVFCSVLDKFYNGKRDEKTINLLKNNVN